MLCCIAKLLSGMLNRRKIWDLWPYGQHGTVQDNAHTHNTTVFALKILLFLAKYSTILFKWKGFFWVKGLRYNRKHLKWMLHRYKTCRNNYDNVKREYTENIDLWPKSLVYMVPNNMSTDYYLTAISMCIHLLKGNNERQHNNNANNKF